MRKYTCHDCGANEGQIHDYGCDMEACPFCGNQLITCSCRYTLTGYDYIPPEWDEAAGTFRGHPTRGLPPEVYSGGLPDDKQAEFRQKLEQKGRVPYIVYPNLCARCGSLWPEMFRVSDGIWERYVPLREREKLLCLGCFREIVTLIDADPAVLAMLEKIKKPEHLPEPQCTCHVSLATGICLPGCPLGIKTGKRYPTWDDVPNDVLTEERYVARHGHPPPVCEKCHRRAYDIDRGTCPLCALKARAAAEAKGQS